MTLSILYGKQVIDIALPEENAVDTVSYRNEPVPDPDLCIREALARPIGTLRLSEIAKGKRDAVILISDSTRLCPSDAFLGALVAELNAGGIADERISIVVALGMHRKQTETELIGLAGRDIYRRVRVINHSALPEDCVRVGTTMQGTPVEINRTVVRADLRIATGNIEPHRLAGISGGVKALVPGVASQACIEHNHALSQRFPTEAGDPDNAVHRDMEEALRFVPIDFLFNVIVNHRRELIAAVSGHVTMAHRAGVEIARRLFVVPTHKAYDVVLASPGGYPKDTQLYQAVKSMLNAAELTKPGGTILLAARCEELYGNGVMQHWVETIQDRARIVSMLKQKFVLGAHKIAHVDRVLQQHTVYLYSDVPPAIAELLGFIPVDDLQQKAEELFADRTKAMAFMPHAAITFPHRPKKLLVKSETGGPS